MMVDIGAPIRHDMTEEEYKKVFGLWPQNRGFWNT